MPGAAPHIEGGDSKYQDHSRVVTCLRSVILTLRAAVLESFTAGPHGGAEVYGILFGTHSGDEVRIAEFQVIAFQSAMAGAIPLSQEERKAFAGALGSTAGSRDPKGLEPVGWFRAHPHSELSLTARDLEIASTFFPAAHQVVMILRPSDSQLSLVRFFYRESDGILKTESPFCELSVPPDFEGLRRVDVPAVRDVPAAREAQTETPQSRGPEPVERERQTQPAFSRSPEPPAPAVNLPPTPAHDDPVMYLPEPPLPRRRVGVAWLMVLAIAIALVAAWYWLRPQPAQSLALRVFDTGGQLHIMWDPVSNGDTGNLQIIDGANRYSVTLDPDQLRGGTFTYARHTNSVSVRLEASRRGAGIVAETASFVGKKETPAEVNPPPVGSASREAPPKTSRPTPTVAEKPAELVVSVPVKVRAPRPKFSAPAMRASGSTHQATNLAAPPLIAQNSPAYVPAALRPVEKPGPPAAQPASVPAQAAAKPSVTPAPPRATSTLGSGAPAPVTPASGRIIWIGRLQKNQEVAIYGKFCSTGTLMGELPGKPLKFSISPGDLSSDGIVLYTANPKYANNVIESPGAQNGWNKTIYTWNPKYANDVTVREAPSAQNRWNNMILRSKNPKISVVVIDWSLVN